MKRGVNGKRKGCVGTHVAELGCLVARLDALVWE